MEINLLINPTIKMKPQTEKTENEIKDFKKLYKKYNLFYKIAFNKGYQKAFQKVLEIINKRIRDLEIEREKNAKLVGEHFGQLARIYQTCIEELEELTQNLNQEKEKCQKPK